MLKRTAIAVATLAALAPVGLARAGPIRPSKKDVLVEFEGPGGACAAPDWTSEPCCQSFCFRITNRSRKTLATARWFVKGTIEGGTTQYQWKGIHGQDLRHDLLIDPGKSRVACFDGRWERMSTCDQRLNLSTKVTEAKFQ